MGSFIDYKTRFFDKLVSFDEQEGNFNTFLGKYPSVTRDAPLDGNLFEVFS